MAERDLIATAQERIVVFDGGMGATLEQFDLTQADYGGQEGKCHEAPSRASLGRAAN
jgi:5-methyltetrahydrofolate--homocysteine methyltransferase